MRKPAPIYSLPLVFHPEQDAGYVHFEGSANHPFEAHADAVSRVNAWWLAEAALLSYWERAEAIPIFEAAGFQARFLTAAGTDCYVAWQKDFVIVAFRGTQPGKWEDILADIKVRLEAWPHGQVHRGFKAAFEVIRPELDDVLGDLGPGRTLWVTGHSLGAAVATLAADHYQARGVCTFGSPRVGDQAFVRAFDRLSGRSLRYVNNHDVVTHVPAPHPYEHVDDERFIDSDGNVSTRTPAFVHFFDDLFGGPKALLEIIRGLLLSSARNGPMFLLNHMPKAYAIFLWNDYDANLPASRR